MKKLFAVLGCFSLLGFGCASSPEPVADTPAENVVTQPPVENPPAETVPEQPVPEAPIAETGLQAMPSFTAPETPIDDSTWTRTTTRGGASLAYPTKGATAPTWTYARLQMSDARLKSGCYVTADTMYQKMHGSACQTSSAFGAGPGKRMDYVAVARDGGVDLFTFTKTYPLNFSMDAYSATMEKIIGTIK